MAYRPISNTVPQYHVSGSPAADYYLKFYQSGTTSAISMATDVTGDTTLSRCALNAEGYPINGSSAVFIPHINTKYKIALYPTQDDADNDTTANAVWIVDNLSTADRQNFTEYELGSTAAATSHPSIITGHIIETTYLDSNRTDSSGGQFRYTGTTDANDAGNWPHTDGFFYDVDGKQFELLGIQDFRCFGGFPGQGSGVDQTPILNIMQAAVENTGNRKCFIPAGTYYFNTKPNDIDFKINIRGEGQNNTLLVRSFSVSNIYDGLFSFKTGASSAVLGDMSVSSDADCRSGGAGTGCNVSIVADSTGSPSWVLLDNLYLTTMGSSGTENCKWTLYVDGSANQTGSPGVRDLQLNHVSCFGNETGACYLNSVVACKGVLDCFVAGGASGELQIDGTGTGAQKSTAVQISGAQVPELALANVERTALTFGAIAGNISNTSDTDKVTIMGFCAGVVSDNWTDSQYLGPFGDSTAADGDTTPSVAGLSVLTMANSGATTVTYLDDMLANQKVHIICDGNTTFDFSGTSMKGNNGVDLTPANGDLIKAEKLPSGSNIYFSPVIEV